MALTLKVDHDWHFMQKNQKKILVVTIKNAEFELPDYFNVHHSCMYFNLDPEKYAQTVWTNYIGIEAYDLDGSIMQRCEKSKCNKFQHNNPNSYPKFCYITTRKIKVIKSQLDTILRVPIIATCAPTHTSISKKNNCFLLEVAIFIKGIKFCSVVSIKFRTSKKGPKPASPRSVGPASPRDEAPISPRDEAPISPRNSVPTSPHYVFLTSPKPVPTSPRNEALTSPSNAAISPRNEAPISPRNEAPISPHKLVPTSPRNAVPTSPRKPVPTSPHYVFLTSPKPVPTSPRNEALTSPRNAVPTSPRKPVPTSPCVQVEKPNLLDGLDFQNATSNNSYNIEKKQSKRLNKNVNNENNNKR